MKSSMPRNHFSIRSAESTLQVGTTVDTPAPKTNRHTARCTFAPSQVSFSWLELTATYAEFREDPAKLWAAVARFKADPRDFVLCVRARVRPLGNQNSFRIVDFVRHAK